MKASEKIYLTGLKAGDIPLVHACESVTAVLLGALSTVFGEPLDGWIAEALHGTG